MLGFVCRLVYGVAGFFVFGSPFVGGFAEVVYFLVALGLASVVGGGLSRLSVGFSRLFGFRCGVFSLFVLRWVFQLCSRCRLGAFGGFFSGEGFFVRLLEWVLLARFAFEQVVFFGFALGGVCLAAACAVLAVVDAGWLLPGSFSLVGFGSGGAGGGSFFLAGFFFGVLFGAL
ncbi:hypothetical protein [Papillibacter cinnamivorans]|uniref:hypothetical protein n=1 Tax=Papillibacter cinnamivorans TaxID=100176 RepID=UPI000A012A4C|nr:hypothetical protein [Papillibacter cinnamivorans]